MVPSSPSPYHSLHKDPSMPSTSRRKRSFRVFQESSTLLRTRGYLIPLPVTANPLPELLEPRSTTPTFLPRPSSFAKMFHRKPKPHLSRLPSIDPNATLSNNNNNNRPDSSSDIVLHILSEPRAPVVPAASMTAPLPSPSAMCSIPIDLYYTNEFHTTLSTSVTLSGWKVLDADLSLLSSLQLSCANPSQHLQHIYLNECSDFTDAGLTSLGGLPSLRTLHCRSCPQLLGHGLFAFASSASLADLDVSSNPWVHDAVFAFIVRSFSKLQSLRIAHCTQVTNQGLYALADRPHSSFTPLLQLDVSGCIKLSDAGLLVVLTHCLKLEHITIAHLPALEGITMYAALPQQRLSPCMLAHVDLSHTKSLHFSVLPNIAKGCGRRLTRLNLTHTHGVSDAGLMALGKHCPHLEVLTLNGCCDITDVGVTHLVQYVPVLNEHDADFELHPTTARCTQLRALDLTGCVLVSTIGVVAVATQCPHLTTLALHGVPHIDSIAHVELAARCRLLADVGVTGMLVSAGDSTNFFAAPKLPPASLRALLVDSTATSFNFTKSACEPDHVAAALRAATSRQFKDLHLGSLVTDDVCAALVLCLTACNSSLRTLDLSRSRRFSTSSLQRVLQVTPQLTSLDIEHCDQLTNDLFVTLTQSCRHLEHLNVAGNVYISDIGVRCLEPETVCPRLMSLTVRGCANVTKACLAAVAATHPRSQVGDGGLEPRPFDIGGFLARRRAVHQAACKVITWMRLCLQRYREHQLRRRLRWTRLNFRAQCARRIQRRVRAIRSAAAEAARVRQAAIDAAVRRDAAARVLVRYLRVFMLRLVIRRQVDAKRAADAFDAAVRKRFVENTATIAIQRAYRYYRGRLVTIQWQDRLTAYKTCRHRRALQVQQLVRGHRGRLTALALLQTEQTTLFAYMFNGYETMLASLALHRVARGFLGRRRAGARRAYVSDVARIRTASASVIQRAFRAYFAGIALSRHLFSNAATIQALVRGRMGRKQAALYVLQQRYASPVVLCLLATRSIFQLKLAQPWQAKRHAGTHVAMSMQRCWRGYRGRVKANAQRSHHLHQMYMEDVSARVLQRFFAHIR
ncbi:hypothetical protein DYB25_011349 [Aphanomyces astaci]|uniref:F-box/LRR-repeat protein 15-like leucin rich repeat domain-containing protein n=1 Tax=Aphanomyces astaci TaxID=112090 RepID=A0A397B0I3_APHAT|nr:hypothetical protein DYB25_011349 [Aphanomyces astaci]